jgi:hypothetical protein
MFSWRSVGGDATTPPSFISGSNILGRFWAPSSNSSSNSSKKERITVAEPKGAERLPPNIVVAESDLHLRRLWGNFREVPFILLTTLLSFPPSSSPKELKGKEKKAE